MPNIHNVKSKDILKFMLTNGFEISHQRGSHIQLKNGTFKVTIPNHAGKILNIKTVNSIFRQSGIDKYSYLNNNKKGNTKK